MIVRMRDHVEMLSSVLEPLGGTEFEVTIKASALAWCLSGLATDLDEVATAIRWSKRWPAANLVSVQLPGANAASRRLLRSGLLTQECFPMTIGDLATESHHR
jgi:hypothetical protein